MNLYQRRPEPPCEGVTITQEMVDGTEALPDSVFRDGTTRGLYVQDCTGQVLWERDWVRVEEGGQ